MRKPDPISFRKAQVKLFFGLVFLFSVFVNLLMLTGPLFMLQVYDRVLGSRSEETLIALFLLVAALYGFHALLEFGRGRVMARVGARIQDAFNARVFRKMISSTARRSGDAKGVRSLQDLEAVRVFFTSPVALTLFDIPWSPLFFLAIFIFHPLLGWMSLFGGGILILIAIGNQLLTYKKMREAQTQTAVATNFAKEAEFSADFIWGQGMASTMTDRWLSAQDQSLEKTIAANDWTGSFTSASKSFRLFMQSAMLALGAWLVLKGELSGGAMIAASIMLGRALAPIEQSLSQWPVVQRAIAGRRAVKLLFANTYEDFEPMDLPTPQASLRLDQVSLLTSPTQTVLSSMSFELKPGQALGIIGKSGAGKSTLARVMLGLSQPTRGTVRLGGAELHQYSPERLGELIGYLPQDVRFFNGSVAENIAHMSLSPDASQVVAAAKKAGVHEIILTLKEGYDTPLSAVNTQLSGGQKQRLALARALYKDPIILILDEPNSALDADGSNALNVTIQDMKAAGKGVIIMTHRPSAISHCNQLLVVVDGKIAANGPRDEVIKSMVKNADAVKQAVR